MDLINYLEDLFESISDYRKIVFLVCLIYNDVDLLNVCGFPKNYHERLHDELKKFFNEENEDYLN